MPLGWAYDKPLCGRSCPHRHFSGWEKLIPKGSVGRGCRGGGEGARSNFFSVLQIFPTRLSLVRPLPLDILAGAQALGGSEEAKEALKAGRRVYPVFPAPTHPLSPPDAPVRAKPSHCPCPPPKSEKPSGLDAWSSYRNKRWREGRGKRQGGWVFGRASGTVVG